MVTKSPTTTISEYASFGNELNLKALISRECRRVCCVLTVLFLLWPREKRIIKSRYFWVPQVSFISCLFTYFFVIIIICLFTIFYFAKFFVILISQKDHYFYRNFQQRVNFFCEINFTKFFQLFFFNLFPDLVPWMPPGKPKERSFNSLVHKKNSGVYDLTESQALKNGIWSTKNSKKFSTDSSPWSIRWNKE